MDEIKRLINIELDPDFKERKKEAKKIRGFDPSGVKILHYISSNLIEVYEVSSNSEFLMDYVGLMRILDVLGFKERQLELSKSKLLNGYYTIFDFDKKEIMIYEKEEKSKVIGSLFTQKRQESEGGYSDEGEEEGLSFSTEYNYRNKN